ncbi:MAG: HAD family hydrolase [Deltaproteobacteria bacterium]|nr:HAD family hydrolase [Deltaproteobacteria bacterium]MBW2673638.1 HAD family hydrolase [Deltaproteobacteria bacterium]
MKKLFIFDFDGVIADSLVFYEALVKTHLERIGSPVITTREEFLDLFDGNFYESLRVRGVDMTAFNNAVMAAAPEIDYTKILPFEDVLPVMTTLAKDNTLLVISSNVSSVIRTFLSCYGLDGLFDDVLGADFMLSKTDKINHAVERYHAHRDRAYYVGDTVGDIREGRAAGIRTVAVTWGWHPRERFEGVGADHIIGAPEDLLAI